MSHSVRSYILSKLQQRRDENNFRSLKINSGLVDFYSNDYLGFASDEKLKQNIIDELKTHPELSIGSTGSRLLSGNNSYVQKLEKFLTEFHGGEEALIFNSGFNANYGLLSTLPFRGDTIIYDELVHASIHDGMRNSKAKSVSFRHNDVADLEEKLKSAHGLKYVVAETVYSMDGDFPPLKEISDLCEKYDAGFIIDEAHALGTQGVNGEGRWTSEIKTVARVYTFGKALGAQGAAIVCSEELKQFLVNYCRPFIFSTALPSYSLAAIKCAYEYLPLANERREKLLALIALFKKQIEGWSVKTPTTKGNLSVGVAPTELSFTLLPSNSPIQSIIVSGNENVKSLAEKIQKNGFDVRPILPPTVPKGKERIRVCLHSFNTEEEVQRLTASLL